jgi:diguanylate cyclase (GGDEF)-like protein
MLTYNRFRIFIGCCVGLLVFTSASLDLTWFVVPPAALPTVWPASGILLAALLLAPPPAWPLLLISAGVAMGLAQLWAGTPPLVSVALALAHLAEAVLAATLVRRWSAAPLAMTRLRDLVGLVAIAAVASNALTALLEASIVWASFGAPFWQSWQIWFIADGVSMLLLNPLAASLDTHLYIMIVVSTAYVMAMLVSERAAEHAALVQAKELLRTNAAILHSFFDSATMMMGIIELIDDDILHIVDNAVTQRFFGLPADISYPYHASAIGVPPEHIRLWRAQYVACSHCGTPVTFEYAHITTTGPRMLAVSVSLMIAGPTDTPQRFAYLVEDVTERRQTEADLRAAHDLYAFQSSHDSLTGMLNRRAITDHVDAELARANRGSYPLSLILLDIDHFKAVNDQHGHLLGDHALIHIAQILTQTVRPFDWVGRWGGEEFLVVLSSTGLNDACMIAERLRAQIAANPLRRPDETELHLTVSIGIASTGLSLDSAGDPEQLFRYADDALYTAKRNGRNQIRIATMNADPL